MTGRFLEVLPSVVHHAEREMELRPSAVAEILLVEERCHHRKIMIGNRAPQLRSPLIIDLAELGMRHRLGGFLVGPLEITEFRVEVREAESRGRQFRVEFEGFSERRFREIRLLQLCINLTHPVMSLGMVGLDGQRDR